MPLPSARELRARLQSSAVRVARGRRRQASTPGSGTRGTGPERRGPEESSGTLLLDRLLRNGDLAGGVLAQVRAWLEEGAEEPAVSLGESLRTHAATREVGDLASGVVAFHRGYLELAWSRFERVDAAAWGAHAPEEWFSCGLATDRDHAVAEMRRVLVEQPGLVRLGDWITVSGVALGAAEYDLAHEVFGHVDEVAELHEGRAESVDRRRDWMRPWLTAPIEDTAPRGERPTFAVMDYGHPQLSRGSANIGDHVQSIASLGHLVRHEGVRWHGEERLRGLLETLAARTRPELRLDDVESDVDVVTIHRDASIFQTIPEGTWTLCFGWFMHRLFRQGYGFPLHRALRPLFVSFHCNKRDLLTDEAVAYLKQYGPVGCRDWTTVYLLLSAGVPAFFSGCLTTTVSTVFRELDQRPPADAPVGYIDVPDSMVTPGAPTFAHSDRAVRTRSFLENCERAVTLLETYRRELSGVVTSRLHAYLPLRSLGVPVDFRPKNLSDIRFDGLGGISDAAFEDIRTGILDLLREEFSLILSGASEETVYARWRELTADRVAAAEQRLHAEAEPLPPVPEPLAERVSTAVAETATVGAGQTVQEEQPPVHVAVFVTQAEVGRLKPLVASLTEHASRPLHIWVLGRFKGTQARQHLAEAFPRVTFSWVRTGPLDRAMSPPRRAPESVARVLLRELLPEVDRVVVLPPATVVDGDVAELAALDLGEHALAAAHSRRSTSSGFHTLHQAAARLGDDTVRSAELRRTAHSRHAFDFDAFGVDLLVVDLPRLADQVPAGTAVGLMERYGLTPAEVLLYVVGPDRAEIPESWQHNPLEDGVVDPLLTRWTARPWRRSFTPEQDRWLRYARGLEAANSA